MKHTVTTQIITVDDINLAYDPSSESFIYVQNSKTKPIKIDEKKEYILLPRTGNHGRYFSILKAA